MPAWPAAGCGGGSGAGLSGSGGPAAGGEGLGGSSGGGSRTPSRRPQDGRRGQDRGRPVGLVRPTARRASTPAGVVFPPLRRAAAVEIPPPDPPPTRFARGTRGGRSAAGKSLNRRQAPPGGHSPPGPPGRLGKRGGDLAVARSRFGAAFGRKLVLRPPGGGRRRPRYRSVFPPPFPPPRGGACGARARSRLRARPVFSCF